MVEKKLLSICVFSYNQPDEIDRFLDSIKNQVVSEVEVLIRDDSTNTETEIVVKKYLEFFPIRYVRGKKEGIDKTAIFLTREAAGEYIWWMGDDVITSGAIKKVLDHVHNYPETDFIWANYRVFGNEELAINYPSDRFFINTDELLKSAVAGLGFISATIFKKEKALEGIKLAEKYEGSLFSNLCIVLNVLSNGGPAYYFREPLLICYPTVPEEIKEMVRRSGVNRGFEVYGITFFDIFHEFADRFKKSTIRVVIKKNFSSLWRGMVVAWIGGWDDPKGKKIAMFKRYWTYPEAWVAIVLFNLPLLVNRTLFYLYKLFFSHRRFRFGSHRWKEAEIK